MVPDFGLLLPVGLARWQTHSLPALLSFCLPVGLCAYGLTHALIRPALLEVLPDGPYARLRRARVQSAWSHPGTWLAVIAALLFGALTHLIWDGFTHENARGVRLFPQLLDYGPEMAGHALRLYKWLQYGSSVVGLVLVMMALGVWLRHAPAPQPRPRRRLASTERATWMCLYVALPAGAVAVLCLRLALRSPALLFTASSVGTLAVVAMRATAISLLLLSGLIRARLAAAA